MINITIASDSSFYICFLDDINRPQYLLRLLNYERFKFVIGSLIKKEIGKSPNYQVIKRGIESHVRIFAYYNYGEILRTFFSLEEIRKGEHEIIVISYILHFLKVDFVTILDEEGVKNFLKINFPEISTRVTGTIGFIENCSCSYRIFSKEEAITILNLIKKSKFRVNDHIVNKVIEKIKEY